MTKVGASIEGKAGATSGAIPARPESPAKALSITDFLTDGSLAALCDELTALAGVPVHLRDAKGRVIVRRGGRGDGPSWKIVEGSMPPIPEADDADRAEASLDALRAAGFTVLPLQIGEATIGSFTMAPASEGATQSPEARATLARVLDMLARAAGELCEQELVLRHRIKEASAVYRVSSMLARAAGPDRVLDVALESVMEAMELDAGAIMLLKQDFDGVTSENEEDLFVAASRNLSSEWLEYPAPLSKGRLFDRLALNGHVVLSQDLLADDRVLIPELAEKEGLRAAIHAGLVFQDRPIGLFRLYSRSPRKFTEEDRRLLKSIAQQAAVAVEQSRLIRSEREKQKVQRQIDLAADVQRRMLPKTPVVAGLDVAAKYHPSLELGGDFYDFIDLNGHLGFVVGDVVGKGMAAALLMSAVRASLRAHVQEVYDLNEVVERVNVAMCQDTRDDEFASIWYGVIDPAKLRLTYCSAGHEPTIIVHAPKGRPPGPQDVSELSIGGMVVGIDPQQRYQRAIFDLRPRDVIVAYTDGVVDATSFEGKRFGRQRLRDGVLKALGEKPDISAQELIERIHWEIRRFAGLNQRGDDITLVVIRVLDTPGRKTR